MLQLAPATCLGAFRSPAGWHLEGTREEVLGPQRWELRFSETLAPSLWVPWPSLRPGEFWNTDVGELEPCRPSSRRALTCLPFSGFPHR